MKGRYFASIFFHFEPVGQAVLNSSSDEISTSSQPRLESMEFHNEVTGNHRPIEKPRQHQAERTSNLSNVMQSEPSLDPYQSGFPSVPSLDSKRNIDLGDVINNFADVSTNSFEDESKIWEQEPRKEHFATSHVAAAHGDIDKLIEIAQENREALLSKDHNGWQPIHEAARTGQLKSLETLLRYGSNINEISNFGNGWSPLRIAKDHLNEGHPVLSFLKLHGAIDVGPDEL